MMLYAAMIDLLRQGDDVTAVTEGLKEAVSQMRQALSPSSTIVLKPSPSQEQLRQMEEESARRKRQTEKKETKARASWVKFWKRSAENPDVTLKVSRAERHGVESLAGHGALRKR